MRTLSRQQLVWIGCAIGAAYGLFARVMFGLHNSGDLFKVMSCSFIFGVPFALGFVTIWFGEPQRHRVLSPWAASMACLGCCLLFAWKGLICIFLWLPLFLILSSLGGLVAGVLQAVFPSNRGQIWSLAVVALAPFLAAPLESLRTAASEVRRVHTAIEIRAAPETIWREIRSVPRITEAEHTPSFSHFLGFPRPVEAVLEGNGVGSVRYTRFEGDVLFVERVTEWEEPRRLSFSIHADTDHILPTTFDEHVTVGGRYFDVLNGTYWLEPVGDHRVVLHLSSEQRLSTGFNFYSHLWTETLMADLQRYILGIIKRRCESP